MAEEPRPEPWPRHSEVDEGGLVIGGSSAEDLAAAHGTPLLVVDEQDLRERCKRMCAAFPKVLYAVKAFSAHAVIRIALDEGLGLLAATGGEVEGCLRAGAPPSRIVFHGNAKTDAELELAVTAGVDVVIADGLDELRRIDAVARRSGQAQRVMLRVMP
jgi:diaminopimelate decarboxylase